MKKGLFVVLMAMMSVVTFAAEVVYKTALFGKSYNSKGVSSYTASWSATNNGFTVDVVNANNANNSTSWNYLKMGSKNAAQIGTITTAATIDKAITKVALTIDNITVSSVDSCVLYVSPDKTSWTRIGEFAKQTGVQTVSIATPLANMYYQVIIGTKKSSSNGTVQISKVEYYYEDGSSAVPTITCVDTINFDAFAANSSKEYTEKLNVVASYLTTQNIAVSLSDTTAFSVNTDTLPADGGQLIITAKKSAVGVNEAILTLSSDTVSVDVVIISHVLDFYTMYWNVNGENVDTTVVVEGDALALASRPVAPGACSEKVFVGWAVSSVVASDGSDAVFVTSKTIPTSDATYYAVFADAQYGTETTTDSIKFSEYYVEVESGANVGVGNDVISIGANASVVFDGGSGTEPKYYDNGQAIRLYNGGTMTVTAVSPITEIVMTIPSGYHATTLTVNCDSLNTDTNTWLGESSEVVFTASEQIRFVALKVTSKVATFSNYITICENEPITPTAIENSEVKKNVRKSIVDGKLVITIDGVNYSAQGIRL